METFNLIKFGISDDFSHSFGNNAITNVISLKFNELLVSTTTDIYIIDYKNKMVKTKYQLKFSACTIIPDTKFIIGVSIKKGDLLIYYTNGNSPTLLKKFPTNQTGIYNVVFSKRSQSIITFGSEIKVFNFQYITVKSKINVSITNRSSFPNKLDPSNLVFPQFDPKYEIILLPTEKGIMSFNLDGKKVKQLTTNPATNQTIFSSSSDLKDVLTFDSKSGMILYKNKNKAIQKFETIRSDILAIISIDSENSICLNSCHILFYTNVKTGKTFYYMNLNKNPTRLFLINLYNEPILCACFGSTLRALNLIIPWQVWRLNIEKITKISRCNKYMTAARILVETENSFVKLFSPRDKEQITIQLPDNCNHPIFYFYDRGTFENYTFDSQNQVYNIDVIKITNQLNFVRDTLFFILQNGSIIKIETNVQEGQKEVKLNCQAILMSICRIRLQKNTNNFKWCFAVASENGDLYIIDYFTFDEVCHFSIPNDGLIQMYYHFESNFIVLAFPKKTVLFDLETGKIVDSIEIDGNKTTSLFADFLMYGYESGHIQRVKIENNQLVMCNDVKQKTKNSSRKINKIENHMLKPHSCPITAFSFSPKIWISSGLDGNIVAYNYNFDIICKISLPLPLRSCLIMNGRRDIIVATATEIMEIKNDYLFYDVNTIKIRKTYQSNKNNELNVDNMNVVGEEEEEEEDSVDPEIKEIDNFDKMKDEFFCVNKTSLNNNNNNKNIVEEADASSDAEKNEINKDEMKQIRKFRRNKMANNNNNNNKVSSITNQSVKSLPKKSEDNDINKDEDLKKKSDENQSTKTDQNKIKTDQNKIKTDQNKIKNDEKEKQNSDSNKNLPENEKNDLNKDKNSKENEKKKENNPKSDTKFKSVTNTDSSSLLNKKDEDQNNSNNNSQLNDQDKLNSNGLNKENDTNIDLQASSESDQIKDKDINETDSTQDDKFSESENSNSNSNENDSNLSDNSASIESTENEKSNSLNENADEANQSNESDTQNLSSDLNGNDQSETNEINENDETQINEQDNTNSDLDKSEENQITENTELNENEAINKDSTNEDNEDSKNDFNNDSNETDTQQQQQQEEEEKSETDNNETKTNNDEDSTSTDQQLSTNENETDLKSSIETENNKQEQEEEEQHQEEHQEDEINETSPDDTQDSSQQPNINDLQQQPSVTLDDNICSINDGNFNSDEFFDDNKEDQKSDSNIDPNIIRSPTPPPIRPTLTAGSGSSQYDESDSARFNHERRSRTPSPRRSTRKDSFGGFRIPPNIVIDREAVLALYGRGRVEFRPFVEQIQREFLISHYGEEEGRTRHITLSYVNNLTSSIKKKQKQKNSNHHKSKKSRQSTSLSSQINGNKPDQINNDKLNSNDSIKNNGLTNAVQQQNKGLSISPPRPLRLPPINLNKSFSPTAYVYNYDNNTETFFNKLEINNGVKTPRRMHAYSVRQPLLMIQPKGAYIVKPNVPVKRNQSFRNQRKSPSYKTESPRRRLNMFNSENNEISDNSQNNTNSS